MHVANVLLLANWLDAQQARWAVAGGLVLLGVSLLLLFRTRWGQHPLSKCIVLSLLAHVLLGVYMTTVNLVSVPPEGPAGGSGVEVSLVDGGNEFFSNSSEQDPGAQAEDRAWDAIAGEAPSELAAPSLDTFVLPPADQPVAEPLRESPPDSSIPELAALPSRPAAADAPLPESIALSQPVVRAVSDRSPAAELPADKEPKKELEPLPERQAADPQTAAETLTAENLPKEDSAESTAPKPESPKPEATVAESVAPPAEPAPITALPVEVPQSSPQPATSDETSPAKNLAATPSTPSESVPVAGGSAVPKALQGRTADHLGPRFNGASRRTEAAVANALRWLAMNQSASGRWDPSRLDAGFAAHASTDKHYEGTRPDTGIAGLAVSAFLASGQTHLSGTYRDTIRRGLEFLMSSQDAAGNLGATDNPLERMYCHAMATSALCEAYAMTGDQRLLPAVRAALDNTVRTQDRSFGSWRYPHGRAIDTHQIGWQVMALKSAEYAGLPIPAETRSGVVHFLNTVSAARGGQSFYQPANPLASRPMTAEALAGRQFLDVPLRPEEMRAAYDYLLQEPPGSGLTNHHYWYFGTLALHQAQGEPWRRWNTALQKTLLDTQRVEGSWAGSWDPDAVWGRCCGRVFSTSLCALSLEVYYRYLPPQTETAGRAGAAGR